MPHGYIIKSRRFARWFWRFPRKNQVDGLIVAIAQAVGTEPDKVELVRTGMRPLSRTPLDLELRIDTDSRLTDERAEMAAFTIYEYLIDIVPLWPSWTQPSVGVWLRGINSGTFMGSEEARKILLRFRR